VAYSVQADVTVSAIPPTGADYPTGSTTIAWGRSETKAKSGSISRSLSGAVNTDVFPGGFTSVSHLYVRVSGGSITLKLTSAAGTAQIVPCDQILFLVSKTQPLTAMTISGTADVEFWYAGD